MARWETEEERAALDAQIAERLREGVGVHPIQAELRVGFRRIARVRGDRGIGLPRRYGRHDAATSAALDVEILERLRAGEPAYAICRALPVGRARVAAIREAAGIAPQSGGGRPRPTGAAQDPAGAGGDEGLREAHRLFVTGPRPAVLAGRPRW